ncbi:MAG TPA: PAS domain S-box protein, partial [Chloroflexota bacterium]|nr:PAS domain S-box protein [Chloroflexota bacterium]
MWRKWRAGKTGPGQGAPAINFWEVLNKVATALQRAAHSETAVYDAFREQMTALQLQGSINWFDDSYTTLTIAAVVFPPRLMRILHRFEKMAGQTAVGFELPVSVLEAQRAVIESDTAVFVPDNTPLLEELATQKTRPFFKQFLVTFGGLAGVLAPLHIDGRVRGLLYLTDQNMTADDCTAVTALANHLSIAIENARLLQQTRANEEKMRLLTENVPGVIYQCVNNYTFDMLYLNDAIETLTGYPKEQFLRGEISFRDLYHPGDTFLIQPEREEQAKDGMFHITYRLRHRSGVWRWVEEFGKGVYNEAGKMLFLEGSITDITERKQSEMVQLALYRIATVANSDLSLEQLYQAIHAILGDLMDVRNFFIALVVEPSGLIHLPYFVDEADEYDGAPFDGRGGLTTYVIETEQPQLLSRPELSDLIAQERLRLIGAMPEVWLGTPLQTQGRVFGAIVVQNYHDAQAYTDREKQLLFFVSGQVAAAIDRKRSEDQLRAMAAEIVKQARIFEEVLSTTPDQFVVYDRDGRITFASPSLLQALHLSVVDISGKTMAELAFLPPHIIAQIERDREEIFRNGQPIQGEVQIEGKWGVSDVEYILSPVKDEGGTVTAVVSAARDITQRNKTKAALHHAQKMESLGILAGGVAH